MKIETFQLERNQTLYENQVEINLTESGVHPYTIAELLDPDEVDKLIAMPLGYGHTEGRPGLRAAIASWYPGATADNVAVTHGTSEANLLAILSLLDPGDELIFLVPNFMQMSGLAASFGITVKRISLAAERGWQPDMAAIAAAITPQTRAITFANPGNPTGAVFDDDTIAGILDLARLHDLYVIADEIYRGAEVDRPETKTLYGDWCKTIVTMSLSKSFALAGLRLGWMVAPTGVVIEAARRQDYTSIGTGTVSQILAEKVMTEPLRSRVLERSRTVLSDNVRLLERWLAERPGQFSWCRPQAGGIAFLQYIGDMPSERFSNLLRAEESVFVVAGSWFGLEGHIRVGTGVDQQHLREGLRRLGDFADRHIGSAVAEARGACAIA